MSAVFASAEVIEEALFEAKYSEFLMYYDSL